ncbi:hypothetical protein [Neobacillus drentensis]
MFLRKDATKYLVIRVDELIRKTTIYAKIAFLNYNIGSLKANVE